MSEYDIIYNAKFNYRSIKSIFSMKYTCGLTDVEQIKLFLNKYAGKEDEIKVYLNKNKCIGIVATDMNTGNLRLVQVRDGDWIVVQRYRSLGYDIFIMSPVMYEKLYRRSKN